MKKIDTILWDVDGTLLDFGKSERYALTFCLEKFQKSVTEEIIERYSKINDGFWKRLELGEIENKQEVLLGRFQMLFEEFSIKGISAEEFQNEYKEALGSVYYYQDDSLCLCKTLKGNYRQYIVTNGITYTQEKKLRLAGFYDVMDGVFISEKLGYPKPRKEFFDNCFSQIGEVDLEKTIIIGDSLSSDMQGGKNAGIITCWYNPKNIENVSGLSFDYEIANLQEIVRILEEV